MWKRLAALSVLTFAIACEDDPERPPPAADGPAQGGSAGAGGASGGDDGTSDAGTGLGGDGGACNTLEPPSASIDQNAVSGDPPAGTGGTIQDGTYDLVGASVYVGIAGVPGLTGNRYRGVLQIAGTVLSRTLVFTNTSNATNTTAQAGPFSLNGVNMVLLVDCPTPVQEQLTYSVTNSGASLTLTNLVTREVYVFQRRG